MFGQNPSCRFVEIQARILAIRTGAYSFICGYSSTDALCLRLNQVAWECCVGDSYWYGDYLAAVPFPGVRIRIMDFPKHTETGYQYDSDIRIGKECTTPMTGMDAAYRTVLSSFRRMINILLGYKFLVF